MSIRYPFAPANIRRGLVELVELMDPTHALTLNTDRELSLIRLRSILSTFCMKIDRVIAGRQRVRHIPSDQRLKLIAFPEHLDTNAHLHAAVDLRPLQQVFSDQGSIDWSLRRCWLESTRGSGSVHLEPITSQGWGHYQTKHCLTDDPVYFLSSDFHPA